MMIVTMKIQKSNLLIRKKTRLQNKQLKKIFVIRLTEMKKLARAYIPALAQRYSMVKMKVSCFIVYILASEIPQSSCSYFEKFSIKSAAKLTKTSPCTNRPIECPTCKRIFWSYNMYKHFQVNHSDFDREIWMVTEEEKRLLLHK